MAESPITTRRRLRRLLLLLALLVLGSGIWWRWNGTLAASAAVERPGPAASAVAPLAPAVPPVAVEARHPLVRTLVDATLDDQQRLAGTRDRSLLRQLGDRDRAALRAALADRSDSELMRNEIANLLRHAGEPALADDLLGILADAAEGPLFRAYAMQHLGLLAEEDASLAAGLSRVFEPLLEDPAPLVRREALWWLGRRGHPAAVTLARTALDGDPRQQRPVLDIALRLVNELDWTECAPACRRHVQSSDEVIAVAALEALVVLRDPAARELLTVRLEAPSRLLRSTAQAGLTRLSAAEVAP